LNNLLNEKDKLIKILQEDLATTEKKYHESIKEKEALKSLLNLRANNKSEEAAAAFQSIVHEEDYSDSEINSPSNQIKKKNEEGKKTLNHITINNNTNISNNNNNHFNILSNYKNSAMGINSRNKAKSRHYFDTSKLNDSGENKMNMTIDINSNKPSNFAMFNNNLTSRNTKVKIIRIRISNFINHCYFDELK